MQRATHGAVTYHGAMDGTAAELCADQVRRFDPDRYLATLFAPPAARPALWAVYAFAGEVVRARGQREELAREIRLQWWRDRIVEIQAGTAQDALIARALAHAAQAHGFDRSRLDALVDADRLRASALAVQLALEVLGAADPDSMAAGELVGKAVALLAGLREGRRGADEVSTVAEDARRHLDAARALRSRVASAALPALLPAVPARHDLDRLARAGHDPAVLARPKPVSRPLRMALAAWRGRY